MKPLFLINFKAYPEALGEQAQALVRICEKVAKATDTDIAVAPQQADLRFIAKSTSLKVFAQHVDPVDEGAYTGHATALAAKDAGCFGVLINHSEKQVTVEQGGKIASRCRELGLVTMYCAATPDAVARIRKHQPDFIAIEPPELIGGKVSVSTAKPRVITLSIDKAEGIPVLCGAGIHSKADSQKAIELGAEGILVASGVVKAGKDREKAITQLAQGLGKGK